MSLAVDAIGFRGVLQLAAEVSCDVSEDFTPFFFRLTQFAQADAEAILVIFRVEAIPFPKRRSKLFCTMHKETRALFCIYFY